MPATQDQIRREAEAARSTVTGLLRDLIATPSLSTGEEVVSTRLLEEAGRLGAACAST